MDHLPLFDHSLTLRYKVLFQASDLYDNEGFWEFPQRRGFPKEHFVYGFRQGFAEVLDMRPKARGQLLGVRGRKQPVGEYAPFLLSWWYFGMLHEVLQHPVSLDDYFDTDADGSRILTSRHLPDAIAAWGSRLDSIPKDLAREKVRSALACINEVQQYVRVLSKTIENFREDAQNRIGWQRPVETEEDVRMVLTRVYWFKNSRIIFPDSLEMVISVLGYTLAFAARSIYLKLELGTVDSGDCPRVPLWDVPATLFEFMKSQNFCPVELERFRPNLMLVGMCIASTLDCRTKNSRSHAGCTKDRCSADNIDHDTYTRIHASPGCPCGDVMPPDGYKRVLEILEMGKTPIVRVEEHENTDTLGTSLSFQIVAAGPDHNYVAFSHIWADGRGNVIGNELYNCQWLQLQSMAQYWLTLLERDAQVPFKGPAFFWIDTFCIPRSRDQHMIDLRNEAILRMSQTYREAQGVLVLEAQLECLEKSQLNVLEASLRITFSGWMRRLWTLHEGNVNNIVGVQTRAGIALLFETYAANMGLMNKNGDPNEKQIIGHLGLMEATQTWASCLRTNEEGEQAVFFFAWTESRRRSTSVPSDRYLVMAIILELDQHTLRLLQRRDEDYNNPDGASERKVKVILQAYPALPQGLLFCRGKHFSDPGFRWAPRSIDQRIPFDYTHPAERLPQGLLVRYPAIQLSRHPDWTREFKGDHRDGGHADFGVRMANEPETSHFHAVNFTQRDFRIDDIPKDSRLAIVLQPHLEKKVEFRNGVLVSLTEVQGGEDETVIYAQYLVGVEWGDHGPGNHDVLKTRIEANDFEEVPADWYDGGKELRWCIG